MIYAKLYKCPKCTAQIGVTEARDFIKTRQTGTHELWRNRVEKSRGENRGEKGVGGGAKNGGLEVSGLFFIGRVRGFGIVVVFQKIIDIFHCHFSQNNQAIRTCGARVHFTGRCFVKKSV